MKTKLKKMRQQCSDKPVFFFNGTRGLRINLEEVVFVTSNHNHCTVVMEDGRCHNLSCQLGQLENVLSDYDSFVRIHRQTIVNIWHIESFLGTVITMDTGVRLCIGRTFQNCFDSLFTVIFEQREKK